MSCSCSNSGCTDGNSCTPNQYASGIVYDGQGFVCAELNGIKPNCDDLSDVVGAIGAALCTALGGGLNGLDGASYKAVSGSTEALDGLLTSRSILITPIVGVASTGTAYEIGCRVRLASLANPTVDYFEGVITAFDNTTGAMTFLADHFGPTASGNHNDWVVSLAGDVGTAGANGAPGGVPVPEYPVQVQLVAQLGIQPPNTVWPGSSYTIPVAKDGNYEVYLEGWSEIDMNVGNQPKNEVQIMKNGAPIPPGNGMLHWNRNGGVGKQTVPYSLRVIDVPLVAGDVITVEISMNTTGTQLSGGNYQIIKRG